MKQLRFLALLFGITLSLSQLIAGPGTPPQHAQSYIIHIYVVPPQNKPHIKVGFEFIDADDGQSFGSPVSEDVWGSTDVSESIQPSEKTRRIKVKFEPLDIEGFKIKPVESNPIELRPKMYGSVTWLLATVSEEKAYLDNVTTAASSLTKKDANDAIARANYAGAVANTANQRLEAARIEANGYLAKNDPKAALTVFDKVVNEGLKKADPSKQKTFLGEWLDVLEIAAKAEGAKPDKETGLIFSSLQPDSKLRNEFKKFTDVFAQIVPAFKENIAGVPESDIAERERIARGELAIIIRDRARRPKARK
jgi:hypothetical protein